MTEKYYSIRIGDPRRHKPYLMLSGDDKTPLLFATHDEAVKALKTRQGPCRKVVRVKMEFK